VPESSALSRLLGSLSSDPIGDECVRLLRLLRDRCPGVLSADPLPAGTLGPLLPLTISQAGDLYRLVARTVTGLPDPPGDPQTPPVPGIVVWSRGHDELGVVVDKITLRFEDGIVAVGMPVLCDEIGDGVVLVRFAVGSKGRPAGMLVSTDERPFGPPVVVDAWAEELTAFAWQTLMTAMSRLADRTGRDADGAGLVPVALACTPEGLALQTMARHTFDRSNS
jgi:hypothetical protein